MGDAEFAGGGSVTWAINHSDGESYKGHKHGAQGKDRCPTTESGMFVITVTGQERLDRSRERNHCSRDLLRRVGERRGLDSGNHESRKAQAVQGEDRDRLTKSVTSSKPASVRSRPWMALSTRRRLNN